MSTRRGACSMRASCASSSSRPSGWRTSGLVERLRQRRCPPARHRRGALRLAMGARFPPRIPPARGRARGARRSVQVVAFTATADKATQDDIVAQLFPRAPRILLHSFDRPNIALSFAPKDKPRLQIDAFLARHPGDSGIVYAASRARTETLAASLGEQGLSRARLSCRSRPRDAEPQPGRLPRRGRRRDRRDHRLRHGHQQAGRALRRARRHAGRHRELLSGDRPRRPRRPAGRHADPLRPRRHGAPAPAARREGAGAGAAADRASAASRR